MSTLVSELRVQTRLFGLAALRDWGELVGVAQEHHAIVDAIAWRDLDVVEQVIYDHSQVRGRWAGHA